ncbi:SH3 domain-containing protein [Streptomyces sp. NBC_00654]|uniref:SH3 domain-containing protein n=1 Tax=Streptomyces sp. NBC_00654 TaxID=2975799 RepID=UPI0022564529|nr:SH3 domain-containing protein [Streptomyces sp. NBC_00654]MCX4967030.1 SH3 domain-containing protein [Streptomyces sp. NBC_00654]
MSTRTLNSPVRTRKWATAAAASLLMAGAVLTATAPAATAVPTGSSACPGGVGWSNKSPGTGTAKGDSALLRSGPSEDCGVTYTVGTAVVLNYHCWVKNSAGNKWTHVRVDNTTFQGWVYNARLDDGGSVHPDNKC